MGLTDAYESIRLINKRMGRNQGESQGTLPKKVELVKTLFTKTSCGQELAHRLVVLPTLVMMDKRTTQGILKAKVGREFRGRVE